MKPFTAIFRCCILLAVLCAPQAALAQTSQPVPSAADEAASATQPDILSRQYEGAFVFSTLPAKEGEPGYLMNGPDNYWLSKTQTESEPLGLVFAFKKTQIALIDGIVLGATSAKPAETRPSRVLVEVSTGHNPLGAYQTVGAFDLRVDQEWQTLFFAEPAYARFVRLTIVDTFGSEDTSIGQIKILEARQPGYVSITTDDREDIVLTDPEELQTRILANEAEPNDTAANAHDVPFGKEIIGIIDPDTDIDVFRVDTRQAGDAFLKIDLEGQPTIKVDVNVKNARGVSVLHQGASERPTAEIGPFNVPPGAYEIELTQPQRANIVLVFDASGSMEGQFTDLAVAADQYLAEKRPNETIKIIRFGSNIDTLSDFTSDSATLRDALRGQLKSSGGTSLYDALISALDSVKDLPGERAIVLLSDGYDSASTKSLWDAWAALRKARVRVYTVGLGEGLLSYEEHLGTATSRLLEFWAASSGGKYFHAPTSKQLVDVYRTVSAELQARPTYSFVPNVLQAGALQVVASQEMLPSQDDPIFELILDASGSMKETRHKVDGRLKMEVAKDVLKELVASLPSQAIVGLRFFGHRVPEGQSGDCEDSELVHPVGMVDRESMLAKIDAVRALGTTPLTLSVFMGFQDLATANLAMGGKPRKMVIILVTDGKEECLQGRTVTQIIEQLVQGVAKLNEQVAPEQGLELDLRFNVVGFALADLETKQDMRTAATATGGQFFDAQDTASLATAIRKSFGDVPYEMIAENGAVLGRGIVGDSSLKLPAGEYSLRILAAGGPFVFEHILVAPHVQTIVDVQKSGADIRLHTTIAGVPLPMQSAPGQESPAVTQGAAANPAAFEGYVGAPSATQPSRGKALVDFLDANLGKQVALDIVLGDEQAKALVSDAYQDEEGNRQFFFTILNDWDNWRDGGTEIAIHVPGNETFAFDALSERRIAGHFEIVDAVGPHQGIFTFVIKPVAASD